MKPTAPILYRLPGRDGSNWVVQMTVTHERGKLAVTARARRIGQPHETRTFTYVTGTGTVEALLNYARGQMNAEL